MNATKHNPFNKEAGAQAPVQNQAAPEAVDAKIVDKTLDQGAPAELDAKQASDAEHAPSYKEHMAAWDSKAEKKAKEETIKIEVTAEAFYGQSRLSPGMHLEVPKSHFTPAWMKKI